MKILDFFFLPTLTLILGLRRNLHFLDFRNPDDLDYISILFEKILQRFGFVMRLLLVLRYFVFFAWFSKNIFLLSQTAFHFQFSLDWTFGKFFFKVLFYSFLKSLCVQGESLILKSFGTNLLSN